MNIMPLPIPLCIHQFKDHEILKPKLLFEILSQSNASAIVDKNDNTNITKCDWNGYSRDNSREWVKTLMPRLTDHLLEWVNYTGFKTFIIRDLWFQQYGIDSEHDWHIHGCNWTGVYYLDLPDESLKTLFKDPMNPLQVNEFLVKEGDILIFPSFIIHKAPKNTSVKIKTIISWNMDIELREV